MFAKPYKLKSNNTLKNSEKKVLLQRIKDEFPKTPEEKIKELVPAKSTCFCMKLSLHSGHTVNVYSADGVPIVIETAEGLVPTVCALWKIPDLVPVLSIHTPVLAKMQKGAPLYLPGVVIPTRGVGFPMFPKGAIISLCTTDNMAAGVVGRAAMSSADMLLKAAGVCVDTLHIVGDQLCKDLKLNKVERPSLGAGDVAAQVSQLNIQPSEEWPSLGPPPSSHPLPACAPPTSHPASAPATSHPPASAAQNEPRVIPDTQPAVPHEDIDDTILTDSSQIEEDHVPTDMDGLLVWCLLTFMKLDGKRVDLPLKTNLLYKNYILPACPPDRSLDVKKSSYKKLGKFLEAMQQEGLLEVREIERGVDAVVALSAAHPRLAAHRGAAATAALRRGAAAAAALRRGAAAAAARQAGTEATAAADYEPPRIREMYCVTAAVAPVLSEYKKGTALTAAEVRAAVTQHVTARQLAGRGTSGAVTLDGALAPLVGKPVQESVKWDALMNGVLSKMTASTETQFSDGTVKLTKTKLEPVKMQVVNRSGNKKVTLVSNLESFGFSLPSLAHVAQTGVAASCGVTRAPGASSDQLMLQGEQTHFVAKLLIEKYGLPKKFVEGADKALNKKK